MENLRGGALMVVAMAGFALEDMFIKQLSNALPVGQILFLLGIGGVIIFSLAAVSQKQPLFDRILLHPAVILRNLGELLAAVFFITAIVLTPLSTASAIIQATPLAITLAAALFLGETVRWRRWSAVIVGFIGVLIIIRPGFSGFQPASLLAVAAVAALALRDLATRAAPKTVSSLQLSCYAYATLIFAGAVMLAVSGNPAPVDLSSWKLLAGAVIFSVLGYYAIVGAMRVGEVSFVAPFRYSRLIFALIIGIIVFGERPDTLTYFGAALIIVSGLYTFIREQKLDKQS